MTVPTETVWMLVMTISGFVIGTLWGHHGAILKRVTYADCSKIREKCPCLKEIEKIKRGKK